MIRLLYMNDTNLTPRQIKILDLLSQGSCSREQIEKIINSSKVTIIRDLNELILKNLVITSGKGKSTVYRSLQNPVLTFVDLGKYFDENSDYRKSAKSEFDFDVFNNLKNLFSTEEKEKINKDSINFDKRGKTIDPTLYKREIERFTVEFAWKSSKIEGNTYTLLETEVLIKNAKEADGRSKYEANMILNHKKAIDFILSDRNYFRELSLDKILKLHLMLIDDLEITSGIRKGPVAITGTSYIPMSEESKLKKALEKTIDLINKTDFPLEKALIASCMIAYIQGFNDGNKRTARTLANAVLISNNYFPLSYRDLNEAEYTKSMIVFYEKNNLYNLKKIITNQYKFSQENYFRI